MSSVKSEKFSILFTDVAPEPRTELDNTVDAQYLFVEKASRKEMLLECS